MLYEEGDFCLPWLTFDAESTICSKHRPNSSKTILSWVVGVADLCFASSSWANIQLQAASVTSKEKKPLAILEKISVYNHCLQWLLKVIIRIIIGCSPLTATKKLTGMWQCNIGISIRMIKSWKHKVFSQSDDFHSKIYLIILLMDHRSFVPS